MLQQVPTSEELQSLKEATRTRRASTNTVSLAEVIPVVILLAMLCPVLLCAALLLLSPLETTEGRALQPSPNAAQFVEQFLERYNDLLTLDDLENMLNSPPDELPPSTGSSGGKSGEYPQNPASTADSPWLRLLRGALTNQKRAEPDRLRRGWNRGCFGLKLDRIGSMSGLGC